MQRHIEQQSVKRGKPYLQKSVTEANASISLISTQVSTISPELSNHLLLQGLV